AAHEQRDESEREEGEQQVVGHHPGETGDVVVVALPVDRLDDAPGPPPDPSGSPAGLGTRACRVRDQPRPLDARRRMAPRPLPARVRSPWTGAPRRKAARAAW